MKKQQRLCTMLSRTDCLCALLLSVLCHQVSAKTLDMAPDAVDDLYLGCSLDVWDKLNSSRLLEEELGRSVEFKAAWEASRGKCAQQPTGVRAEQSAAVWTYAYGSAQLRQTFNDAVERLGTNVSTYQDSFHFKSLHFLLTTSMDFLSETECKTVYSISTTRYTATKGDTVRFGRFLSTQFDYRDLKEDPDLEGGTFFNITSCFVVDVGPKTCTKYGEVDVILSPSEEFTVEKVTAVGDDYPHVEIVLRHKQLRNKLNCDMFSGSPSVLSTPWLVLMVLALSSVWLTH